MSSIATTDIAVASKGLVLIGANPITSFSAISTEATVADTIYEEVVEDLITDFPWRFTVVQDSLNRLLSEPEALWDAAYQLPSNCINVIRVTINDVDIDYAVYGDQVFCNAGADETVVCDFQTRPDETAWPPYFRMAAEFTLAALFAAAVAGDDKLATLWDGKAEVKLRKARNRDSVQQTTSKVDTSRFIAARR